MGSSTILDIIGSFFVGGLLLVSCLQLKLGTTENQFVYNSSVNLQVNLVTLTTRMEDDFRKIAYCQNAEITPAANAVLFADTSTFRFKGDMNNDGTMDSLEYSFGNTYVPGNTRIKAIVRKYWAGSSTAVVDSFKVGATQMFFRYKTANTDSSILTTPVNLQQKAIGVIDLSISLESPSRIIDTSHSFIQDTSLYKVYWRQFRVVGKNLLYR
ncbi:MAG TPA: hypothetical protein VMU30_02875 [Bacteroidota bacterium]|nr:hypothetical protein [Bacteroidota bacterium]